MKSGTYTRDPDLDPGFEAGEALQEFLKRIEENEDVGSCEDRKSALAKFDDVEDVISEVVQHNLGLAGPKNGPGEPARWQRVREEIRRLWPEYRDRWLQGGQE